MKRRMRVERAGGPHAGYGRGWFALTVEQFGYQGEGAWFPTWREAMEFALDGPLVSEATA